MTKTASTTKLADRAVYAARHRGADPTAINRRHDDPARCASLPHRTRIAHAIAAALQVPLCWVTVTNPQRRYRTPQRQVATDLILVTDTAKGTGSWRFIPDTDHGHGWLLIQMTRVGDILTPTIRITTLADIGDYVDPRGDLWPAEFSGEEPPAHHPGCSCQHSS